MLEKISEQESKINFHTGFVSVSEHKASTGGCPAADNSKVQPSFTWGSSVYRPLSMGCSPKIYSLTKTTNTKGDILVKQELCGVVITHYS